MTDKQREDIESYLAIRKELNGADLWPLIMDAIKPRDMMQYAKEVVEHGRHKELGEADAIAYLKVIGIPEKDIPSFTKAIVERDAPYTITTK